MFWGFVLKTSAQNKIKDPTHWNISATKLKGNEYLIVFKVTLDNGWHIWSMHPGGDGTLIPTKLLFNKTKGIDLLGAALEEGKKHSEILEFVEGEVTYFSETVTFSQKLIASKGDKISGYYEYQSCNNQICLPPQTKNFEIILP